MENFLDKFLAFEAKHGLIDQEVDGFHFWVYARFNIQIKLSQMTSGNMAGSIQEKKNILDILCNMTLRHPLLRAPRKEIAFFVHARRVFLDGKFECIYTDKVAEAFGDRAVQCEFLYRNMHLKPAYSKHLQPLDYVDIGAGLRCRLNPAKYRKAEAQLREKVVQVRRLIQEEFGLDVGEAFLHTNLVRAYSRYKEKRQLLGRLLDRIQPKVLVEVVGYTFNNMILNEVALEKGIVTVELQHGVIGNGHIAYNYMTDHSLPCMPQKMFFFSEYWKQTNRFPIGENNKYSVGYPYMEAQVMKYQKTQPKEGTVRIIILSQPEVDKVFAELVEKLMVSPQLGGKNFEVTFKLHPHSYDADKSIYTELLKDPRFKLIDNSKTPLYQLFSESDIQIGSTSTALYEGLSYDLKTFIYHLPNTDIYMGDVCNLGYAEWFEDFGDLQEKLRKSAEPNSVTPQRKVFFETDAKQKMVKQLEALLKECD